MCFSPAGGPVVPQVTIICSLWRCSSHCKWNTHTDTGVQTKSSWLSFKSSQGMIDHLTPSNKQNKDSNQQSQTRKAGCTCMQKHSSTHLLTLTYTSSNCFACFGKCNGQMRAFILRVYTHINAQLKKKAAAALWANSSLHYWCLEMLGVQSLW